MRVLLVGRRSDRDRVRPKLTAAGLTIAGEGLDQPDVLPDAVEAVVVARARPDDPFGVSAAPRDSSELVEPLTPREREVLTLLAEGLPNKAIASALGISDQTVKFHVAAIIGKLGATNRTDAVRRAVRQGLVVI